MIFKKLTFLIIKLYNMERLIFKNSEIYQIAGLPFSENYLSTENGIFENTSEDYTENILNFLETIYKHYELMSLNLLPCILTEFKYKPFCKILMKYNTTYEEEGVRINLDISKLKLYGKTRILQCLLKFLNPLSSKYLINGFNPQ